MKWNNAMKVLPPLGELVLVMHGEYEYQVSSLIISNYEEGKEQRLLFFPWSDEGRSIDLEKGVMWSKIELPTTWKGRR